MLPRWTRLTICLAATLGVASSASADTLQVPGDFPKIQQAVDNADPGDTIAVSKKLNKENVLVNTERLTIKGVGRRVTLDSLGGDPFQINVNGVAVRNFLIKHGDGIDCIADRCRFSSLRFGGASGSDCIYIVGDDGQVVDSKLAACGDNAIEILGAQARVLDNSISLIDSACISVSGNRALIRGNVAGRCEDGQAITYAGDRGTIQNNRLHNTDEDVLSLDGDRIRAVGNTMAGGFFACLDLDGDEALVQGNQGRACRQGLEVNGQNPRVISNRMTDALTDANGEAINVACSVACGDGVLRGNLAADATNDSDGIDVSVAPGTGSFEVVSNVARNSAESGFSLSVPDGVIRDNLAVANGFEQHAGFSVFAPGGRFVNNRAVGNGGDGFSLAGGTGSMEVVGNLARGNHLDGLLVTGAGMVLSENTATNNFGDGIQNQGTDTELRRNRASGNQVDCANTPGSTIAVKKRNRCADGSNFNVPGEI